MPTPIPQTLVTVLDLGDFERLTEEVYGIAYNMTFDIFESKDYGWRLFTSKPEDEAIVERFTGDYEAVSLSWEEALLLWQGSDPFLCDPRSRGPRLPNGRSPEDSYFWQPPTEWILQDLVKRGHLVAGLFFIQLDW